MHDLSFFALPEDFTLPDGARRRLLTGASIRASRIVLACSEHTRSEIVRRFPECASRVRYVALGGDDDLPPAPDREEARRRLDVRGPMLLTVGAIFNRRRLPTLLRVVAALVESWPDLVLDVVGDNRTHPRLDLVAAVHALGLERHVRLSGFVSEADLVLRYAAADVTVFLSEYEGFGLPVLEAMARGLPLVISNRAALGEIFGEAALTVDPYDEPGIVAALRRILSDPDSRREAIARGQALAGRFSWEKTARLTRDALFAASARP